MVIIVVIYMSEEFWRPLASDVEFRFCEICGSEEVNFLQSKEDNGVTLIRFLCRNCHTNRRVVVDAVRQIGDEEVVDGGIREAWLDEFIEEQKASGSLQSIGEVAVHTEELSYAQAPEEEEVPEYFADEVDEEDYTTMAVAPWSAGFVQEALFGIDPETWLNEQGAYKTENLDVTIQTLIGLSHNQTGAVKLTSIKCMSSAAQNANAKQKEKLKNALKMHAEDQDELTAQVANSALSSI